MYNEKPAAKSDGPFNGGATRIRTGDKGFADPAKQPTYCTHSLITHTTYMSFLQFN